MAYFIISHSMSVIFMMQPQTHWRFLHGGDFMMEAHVIRQSLKKVDGINWQEVAVKQSARSVGLIARTPQAALALEANMAPVMRAMANVAKQLLPIDIKSAPVHVASAPMTLYTIPTLIVAKSKGQDWSPWGGPSLSEQQRAQLTDIIRASIESGLKAWSMDWQADGIQLIGDGRPMVISADQGPRSMARLGVRFVAPWHIEGELFAGKLTPMGCGLIKRGGVVHNASTPEAPTQALA